MFYPGHMDQQDNDSQLLMDGGALLEADSQPLEGARAVARGVARLFLRHDILVLSEVSLRNRRRADLMGIDAKGQIVIVEIKVARGDLLGDNKWTEYLDYCDRFYWAVPGDFDHGPLARPEFLPERSGLILADAYDAEIIRPAATHSLAPPRRKTETLRIARRAIGRLAIANEWIDPSFQDHG